MPIPPHLSTSPPTYNHSSTTNDNVTRISASPQIATTEYSAYIHRQRLKPAGRSALYVGKLLKRNQFVFYESFEDPESEVVLNQADFTTRSPSKRTENLLGGASLSLHTTYPTDKLVQRPPVSVKPRSRQPSAGSKSPQAGFNGTS